MHVDKDLGLLALQSGIACVDCVIAREIERLQCVLLLPHTCPMEGENYVHIASAKCASEVTIPSVDSEYAQNARVPDLVTCVLRRGVHRKTPLMSVVAPTQKCLTVTCCTLLPKATISFVVAPASTW